MIALSWAAIGCGGWQAPPAVSVAGDVTNRATPALVAIEQAQGDAEIAAGRDPEKTVAPRWAPFWSAWKAWVAAQRAWADAYARNAPELTQAEAAARAALCEAEKDLPPEVPVALVAIAEIACAPAPSTTAPQPLADAGAEGGV